MCNILYTMLSIKASMANYPGGSSMLRLQQSMDDDSAPSMTSAFLSSQKPDDWLDLHISNLAAQTGASLFLHLYSPPYHASQKTLLPGTIISRPWRYNKTENLSHASLFGPSSAFSLLISEVPPSEVRKFAGNWHTLEAIHGFDRWAINWDLLGGSGRVELLKSVKEVIQFAESEKLWILKKT